MKIKNSALLHILNSIKLFCVYLFVQRKAITYLITNDYGI